MKFLPALLIFCHYIINNGQAEIQTLYSSSNLGEKKTITINSEQDQGFIPTPNGHQRHKRNILTTTDTNGTILQKISYLNDTHKQLMVHWVGEGSNVIICLARDPSSTLLPGLSQIGPSAVYISYDYGDTYTEKTDLFKMANNQYATVEKFYNHPKYNTHFVFTDVQHNLLFVTTNHGRSIKRYELNFTPSEVSFHEYQPSVFVVLDKNDTRQKLFLSEDFGATFIHIHDYVKSFNWFNQNDQTQRLVIQRNEPSGLSTVLHTPVGSNRISTIYGTAIREFSIKGDYFFTTKITNRYTIELYVSLKLGRKYKCVFDVTLPIKSYFIVDVTSNRALVAVSHTENISHLYVSESLEPEDGVVKFTLSLEDVLCYFPNSTWHDSWLHHVSEEAFADVYKLEGLTGIYIASRLLSKPTDSNLGPQHLGSVITFDHGRSWRLINAPAFDVDGQPLSCSINNNCSLHLSQKFSQLYPDSRTISILSSKSAPGILMATGIVGKSLKGHYGVYISQDAGLTWRQTLRDLYFFNMGDHGGILTAVKYFKSKGETRYIFYSTDEGENWNMTTFVKENIRLYGLMTEPGENTTVFTMFGSLPQEHRWIIIKLDMVKAFKYNCTKDDYKTWSPSQSDENRNYIPCVLGQQITFERRMPHANCYNGLDYDTPISQLPCGCDILDYECDFGFVRSKEVGHCIRNSSEYDPFQLPKRCRPGNFFLRTKGYRKIQGDVCVNGFKNHYQPEEIPCPIKETHEFLLFAQRESISRYNLVTREREVLPIKKLKNVIAVDYDMANNCVYWADMASDHIGRQCFNKNGSEAESLVASDLSSIEGMAFDWISHNLYFVDGSRAKIELIRTDINHSGRMRRTILGPQDLIKPRGIALHPKAGYMFWTDWSSEKPSVNRANLDGANIKRLFGRPNVEWPNGITIDLIAERIYWVDAHQDYIASSDLHGDYFKVIVWHEDVVSHPFAVAVFKNTMYWDDWKRNAIFSADKDQYKGVDILQKQLSGLMDLKVYAHGMQIGTNACTNTTCQYVCVGLPTIGQSNCLCPDGMEKTNSHCLCPGGVKPYANATCPQIENSCASDHFTCSNGFCVPKGWRCDGEDDCGDGSDEKQCVGAESCPPSYFVCGNGHCIPQYWKCDYEKDCPDGSDEANCTKKTCAADQFLCSNGKCIGIKWKCDGENDCRDGSDELNCAPNESKQCKNDQFACKGGAIPCIPSSWVCDGEKDCRDESDELNCTQQVCDTNQFSCGAPDYRCIHLLYVCDGDKDCVNGRDEENCTSSVRPPTDNIPAGFQPTNGTCQHWMFKCMNDKCIPYWWKCDGADDCTDGSDELGCTNLETTLAPIPTITTNANGICAGNQFMCESGDCIYLAWVCDGTVDCNGGEDESNCERVRNCTSNQFKCRIDGSCIPLTRVCDKMFDCPDLTDEAACSHLVTTMVPEVACAGGHFACDGSVCLPLAAMCDHRKDCIDNFDELDCGGNKSRIYQVLQMGVDERNVNETVIFLYWWIPTENAVKLEFMPSISPIGENTWKNQSWTDANDFSFTNLTPYQGYNMTVYVRIENTTVVFPYAKYYVAYTSEAVPSEVYNVTAKQRNGSHVLVSWKKPTHPNGILVSYEIVWSPPGEIKLKLSGNETAHLLAADFQPNTRYYFYVIAYNRHFKSKKSNVATLDFDGNSTIDLVENLRVTSTTDNTITLEWTYNKTVDGYKVETEAHGAYPTILPRETNATKVTIDQLSPGVLYHFKVNAFKNSFTGPISSVLEATTGKALPEVVNVKGRIVRQVGNSVEISWDALAGDKRNVAWIYGVYYGINEESLFEKARLETDKVTVNVNDLEACEIYTFRVGVTGPLGLGPLSQSFYQEKTNYNRKAPPKKLSVGEYNGNPLKMKIDWTPSCPVIEGTISYIIRINEITNNKTMRINTNGSDLSHVLDVTYGAIYNVSVRTGAIDSIYSKVATYAAPPIMAPTQVRAYGHENGTFVISWQESSVPKEVGDYSYEVLVANGMEMNEATAKAYLVKDSQFVYENPEWKNLTVAVRILTHDGYKSWTSPQINVVISGAAPGGGGAASATSKGLIVTLSVLVLVALVVIGVIVVKHRRLQNSFTRFANSHYNRKSGSATFEDSNGLDEDDCPQIAGFSDDEPLVVA